MSPILGHIELEIMCRLIKGIGNPIKDMIQSIFFFLSPPPAFVFSNPPVPTHPVPEDDLSFHGLWRLLEKLQLVKLALYLQHFHFLVLLNSVFMEITH